MERRSATGSCSATSWPRTSTRPEVGATIAFTIRMRVVFPQPEVPRKTVVVRSGIRREKSSTATVPPG